MIATNVDISIENWLSTIRTYLSESDPSLMDIFETYAAEAKFGRKFIDGDLKLLKSNASILEVGAGSMILSCQLVSEGYSVTALEPTGEGFSHFSKLRSIVLELARNLGHCPNLLLIRAEELAEIKLYNFAFSVNVMEHVNNVESVISKVSESLKVGGVYHFTCPNYSFFYEPHFNIPTVFSKKTTEFLFKRFIYHNRNMPDPVGTWQSLNWITIGVMKKILAHQTNLTMCFNWKVLEDSFTRISTDQAFASRRSAFIRLLIRGVVFTKLHKLSQYLPTCIQPIIDCKITKMTED